MIAVFRVRNIDSIAPKAAIALASTPAAAGRVGSGRKLMRLAAMTGFGLALGAGGMVLTVTLVQAEDDAGIRAFHRQEAAARQARYQAAPRAVYASARAYAPERNLWTLPLWQARPDGVIAHPKVELNPFKRREAAPKRAAARQPAIRFDTVSGAADMTRTICVRLCDGFHAPIGYLRSQGDLKAHEALCQANNPGIPVKVFKVAAGATTIDGAVASDGRTYRALPVAYGYEQASDPACRPAIVNPGERRVSLLRDITLRPGDSVVLDGKVRTFAGSTKWPYTASDFRDFRDSSDLNARQRREIDARVGISHREAELRSFQRRIRVREASLQDPSFASDAPMLRGGLGPRDRVGPAPRIVLETPFTRN
ncbi:MAG: hypothetical protein ABS59_11750 [Methylobacterium sp. SCN 67-24]|nr:MAG: hypothetical protein ABS59_11750 [Methylobacterium sp. SCN 67-24]